MESPVRIAEEADCGETWVVEERKYQYVALNPWEKGRNKKFV